MGVTVKVNIPIKQITGRFLNKETMMFAASEAKRLMSPFTPCDTGTLEDTAQIEATDTTASIHYVQPYAAVVYYGKRNGKTINIHNQSNPPYEHPLATSFWDKATMEAGGKEKLDAAIQKFIDRRS